MEMYPSQLRQELTLRAAQGLSASCPTLQLLALRKSPRATAGARSAVRRAPLAAPCRFSCSTNLSAPSGSAPYCLMAALPLRAFRVATASVPLCRLLPAGYRLVTPTLMLLLYASRIAVPRRDQQFLCPLCLLRCHARLRAAPSMCLSCFFIAARHPVRGGQHRRAFSSPRFFVAALFFQFLCNSTLFSVKCFVTARRVQHPFPGEGNPCDR